MELEFTSEQDELREGARGVLAAECTPALVRELVEARVAGKTAAADALWSQFVELGWPALNVPERAGGLGLGVVELAVLAEELGRVMAPGPLLPTLSQFVPLVAALGSEDQQEAFLGRVASDGSAGTLAIAEASGEVDPGFVSATATPRGDDIELAGTKHFVMEASAADEIIVVAREPGTEGDDGVGAYVVPRSSVEITTITALDPSRELGSVVLDGVIVSGDRVLGARGTSAAAAIREVLETATVALATETVGTLQTVFDITLAYAKEREQFGVPIGSFQAIKHKFADMLVLLERARALCYFAALTIAEQDERSAVSASMAKAATGDAVARIAKEGIQIHGGIGYTWEHDMHLYVRRLETSSTLFGSASQHRARIADMIGV
jgi:alkylation response protein AidB-like acyl-CoA dehydrogenase